MTRRAARPMRRSLGSDRGRVTEGWRILVTRVRIVGLVLVLVTGASVGWLVTDHRFTLDPASVAVSGLRYTDADAVRSAINLPSGEPNVFLLHTDAMRRALLALPAVADADVHVVLPRGLVVAVTERSAVVQVAHEGAVYLIDSSGVVLERRPDASTIADLPLIRDGRTSLGISFDVGQPIDSTEATAMLQIAALTPSLVGSAAPALQFSVDDSDGFVVSTQGPVGGRPPNGWRAVFGFYTPTLRPPTEIPQQVQCLRSLLATGESAISTIYLAPQDDRCGTYQPRPS